MVSNHFIEIKEKTNNENSDEKSETKLPDTRMNDNDQQQYSIRRDVLNKTLLRSLKKFLTEKFNQKTEFLSLNVKEKYEKFRFLLKDFVTWYYVDILSDNNKQNYDELVENIYFYVGIMTYPSLIKRYVKKKEHIKFKKLYYECAYKYSHSKLDRLFIDPTLKLIFQHYYDSGAASEMIEKDETLSKRKGAYIKCLYQFMKSFEDESFLREGKQRFRKRTYITKVKLENSSWKK